MWALYTVNVLAAALSKNEDLRPTQIITVDHTLSLYTVIFLRFLYASGEENSPIQ
jgi:hypothetical protein